MDWTVVSRPVDNNALHSILHIQQRYFHGQKLGRTSGLTKNNYDRSANKQHVLPTFTRATILDSEVWGRWGSSAVFQFKFPTGNSEILTSVLKWNAPYILCILRVRKKKVLLRPRCEIYYLSSSENMKIKSQHIGSYSIFTQFKLNANCLRINTYFALRVFMMNFKLLL